MPFSPPIGHDAIAVEPFTDQLAAATDVVEAFAALAPTSTTYVQTTSSRELLSAKSGSWRSKRLAVDADVFEFDRGGSPSQMRPVGSQVDVFQEHAFDYVAGVAAQFAQ